MLAGTTANIAGCRLNCLRIDFLLTSHDRARIRITQKMLRQTCVPHLPELCQGVGPPFRSQIAEPVAAGKKALHKKYAVGTTRFALASSVPAPQRLAIDL